MLWWLAYYIMEVESYDKAVAVTAILNPLCMCHILYGQQQCHGAVDFMRTSCYTLGSSLHCCCTLSFIYSFSVCLFIRAFDFSAGEPGEGMLLLLPLNMDVLAAAADLQRCDLCTLLPEHLLDYPMMQERLAGQEKASEDLIQQHRKEVSSLEAALAGAQAAKKTLSEQQAQHSTAGESDLQAAQAAQAEADARASSLQRQIDTLRAQAAASRSGLQEEASSLKASQWHP